jgi:diguanylate cyclase (GGDEF)-like protein
MTVKYAHLLAAVEGRVAVSNVVPSAAEEIPITAFAVPFDTPSGRRVFSGALAVGSTPLGEYLADLTPIANSEVYLLDGNWNTVSSNHPGGTRLSTLHDQNPALEAALLENERGRYPIGEDWGWFVSVPIDGTPWRLVVAAPAADLLSPLAGAATWTPWLLFAAVVASAVTVTAVLLRLSATRAAQLVETERLSVIDTLTGLHNRRGFELLGNQMILSAGRAGQQVGVIFFDLDGLKAINDRFGHDAGDQALKAFASILRRTLRQSDLAARLGGDEFAAILWTVNKADLVSVRARLDHQVRAYNATSPAGLEVAFSMGVSWFNPDDPQTLYRLVEVADAEMYRQKRDRQLRPAKVS